ncbi:MAG: class I SAM-dependent methyltransferase [Firmicutes bacterium]|nr:class I SAM-dependent methyltransferase [Bacillota bacterium]
MEDKEAHLHQYQASYPTVPFEPTQVHYRQLLILERLSRWHPQRIVEVGCGLHSLYARYLQTHPPVDQWLVVEPSPLFAEREGKRRLPRQTVVRGFFEDAWEAVRALMGEPPDFIVMAGLLHEVAHPPALLRAATALMGPHTVLHVSVPNRTSLHRRLALAMGLIDVLDAPSAINRALGQPRVYDQPQLANELERAGLTIVHAGGYFLKPFTHAQMDAIAPLLGAQVLDGLFRLGEALPDLASEIYCDAVLRPSGGNPER